MNRARLKMDALREAVGRLPADSLATTRAAALAELDQRGLPTARDEDWKYTDLGPAINISNRWLAAGGESTPLASNDDALRRISADVDANWLLVANGRIDTTHFADTDGIRVERFTDSPAPFVLEGPLADLNAALLIDGLRIRVDANVTAPIGLMIVDDAEADAAVSQVNIEIEVAQGARAEFVEYQVSRGQGEHFSNAVVALQIADDARARYARIQHRANNHIQTARHAITVGRDAVLKMSSLDVGGALTRNDVAVDLVSPGAHAEFNGIFLVGDGQHIDNHTRVDHRVGPATSQQEYRGILSGRSRGVWNGKAIVHEGADGTDAQQTNHNLLLTQHAEIDAKPELEIYADDVKCAHGTTVGQLDEKALYYLRTRGIDKDTAKRMLTQAFAAGLVNRVPVAAARGFVGRLVEQRLETLVKASSL